MKQVRVLEAEGHGQAVFRAADIWSTPLPLTDKTQFLWHPSFQ